MTDKHIYWQGADSTDRAYGINYDAQNTAIAQAIENPGVPAEESATQVWLWHEEKLYSIFEDTDGQWVSQDHTDPFEDIRDTLDVADDWQTLVSNLVIADKCITEGEFQTLAYSTRNWDRKRYHYFYMSLAGKATLFTADEPLELRRKIETAGIKII